MDKINTTFTGEELLQGIEGLARSQGSYGRMLRALYGEYGMRDNVIKALDNYIYQSQCKDIVDFIMDMEG